jgi:hypothetical protein
MEIEVAFNFIYTMYYNGLVFFKHELNYQLLTCWNHYLKVAFYTYHNSLKHI